MQTKMTEQTLRQFLAAARDYFFGLIQDMDPAMEPAMVPARIRSNDCQGR
jgi:hypothetical protein